MSGPLINTAEGLKFFGEWMERTDRAGSADLAVRVAAGLAKTDHPELEGKDLSKTPTVKRFLKGLKGRIGDDDTGDTPLPLEMHRRIDRDLSNLRRPMLDSRLRGAAAMGFQGGVRADEFSGSTRGWEAGSHTRIYDNRVEVSYTDRKTSDTLETVTITRGTAASGFDIGGVIKDIATQWGMAVRRVAPTPASEAYEYLDHYVLRASLNGIRPEIADRLQTGLERAPDMCGLGKRHESTGQRIRAELSKAITERSHHERDEADRFINLGMGTQAEIRKAEAWWKAQGIPAELLEPLPGPMLLSTVRGSRGTVPVPMPVTTGTLSAELKARMQRAFEEIDFTENPELRDQLSALPTGLSGQPKWNTHSLRRGGTKLARETMLESGAREEDVNFHYGWQEEALKGGRKRQVAYAATVPAKRRMNVTRLF